MYVDGHSPRLLDQLRDAIRVRHYSIRTEQAYVHWVKRFILFHAKRHPREMGEREITVFLTDLAVVEKVAPATQNQALSAILFLYRWVLKQEVDWLEDVVRAKRPKRLPIVLTREEVTLVLGNLDEGYGLIGRLLYGTGMRLIETMRLRVKDLDFDYNEIIVRSGKGAKDRRTMLPQALCDDLQLHLRFVQKLHRADLAEGFGYANLPYALARKAPGADREWGWQYVFPASPDQWIRVPVP